MKEFWRVRHCTKPSECGFRRIELKARIQLDSQYISGGGRRGQEYEELNNGHKTECYQRTDAVLSWQFDTPDI